LKTSALGVLAQLKLQTAMGMQSNEKNFTAQVERWLCGKCRKAFGTVFTKAREGL
jgi:hypothetical protein